MHKNKLRTQARGFGEHVVDKFNTVRNKIIGLIENRPELKNAKNDEIVDSFRETYSDHQTASESITRSLRKIREDGFLRPSDDLQRAKDEAEQDYRKYYGK